MSTSSLILLLNKKIQVLSVLQLPDFQTVSLYNLWRLDKNFNINTHKVGWFHDQLKKTNVSLHHLGEINCRIVGFLEFQWPVSSHGDSRTSDRNDPTWISVYMSFNCDCNYYKLLKIDLILAIINTMLCYILNPSMSLHFSNIISHSL